MIDFEISLDLPVNHSSFSIIHLNRDHQIVSSCGCSECSLRCPEWFVEFRWFHRIFVLIMDCWWCIGILQRPKGSEREKGTDPIQLGSVLSGKLCFVEYQGTVCWAAIPRVWGKFTIRGLEGDGVNDIVFDDECNRTVDGEGTDIESVLGLGGTLWICILCEFVAAVQL